MVLSGIYILDAKGKTLISRNFRGDVESSSTVDKFISHIMEREEEGVRVSPLITVPVMPRDGANCGGEAEKDVIPGQQSVVSRPSYDIESTNGSEDRQQMHFVTMAFIKHNNVYFVATTKRNSNVAMIFTLLHQIKSVFQDYFKDVEEESIRDNFVIVYELLDEMIDFGYPQTTEQKILQEYITQEGQRLDLLGSSQHIPTPYSANNNVSLIRPPAAVTNAVSWRNDGIKYRKNEVFLDVVESVNLLASSTTGCVLRSDIVGSVKMRVYLSGMPELRLGLNDKILFESTGRPKAKCVDLEDVKFHQCVRLSKFDNDRTISFIPPDGEFELMSYRLNTAIKPLIWIDSVIERHPQSRVEYTIKARSQFKRRSTANSVEVIIPVPQDASKPRFKTTLGTCRYVAETSCIVWSIRSLVGGGRECVMHAHIQLPTVNSEVVEGRPPIQVKYEIPYFTTSGIQVRYLKIIEKSGYQALPWVRYITQNGDYQFRTN